MNKTDMAVQSYILGLLEAQEPCTFEQIIAEVANQVPGVYRCNAVPITIDAIAKLQQADAICSYDQDWEEEENLLEFAWVLSEEPTSGVMEDYGDTWLD
jgi:hypothetical protein